MSASCGTCMIDDAMLGSAAQLPQLMQCYTQRIRCDWSMRRARHAGATKKKSSARKMGKAPSFSDSVATASAALHIVQHRASAGVALADDAVFRAAVGWPQRRLHAGHPAATTSSSARDALLEAIVRLVTLSSVSLEAHCEAVRRFLLPTRGSIDSLRALPDALWHMARELLQAKKLVECAIDPAALVALAVVDSAPSRDDFARAFGLALRRPHRFRAAPEENRARSTLEPRVRAAASGGSCDGLSLEEQLVLARPDVTEAWRSPFAYFVQNGIGHFGEAHTKEGVDALAAYLARRRDELGGARPIVEIGAGDGRLAFLLNRTGRVTVVATDPTPQPSSTFPVQKLGDEAAIRMHRPCLLLCAWMSFGEDWTPRWRRPLAGGGNGHGVDEYVLIGALGQKQPAYSLSACFSHAPYQRVVLDSVSTELLGIEAGMENSPLDVPGCSNLCAVAYRRPGAPTHEPGD